ncbi:unnamed protein product, partial [Iphiclides podalirius]
MYACRLSILTHLPSRRLSICGPLPPRALPLPRITRKANYSKVTKTQTKISGRQMRRVRFVGGERRRRHSTPPTNACIDVSGGVGGLYRERGRGYHKPNGRETRGGKGGGGIGPGEAARL